jgi:2-amino-4-hydroxy-6-hydroxymethyldihydropteridine diphosphokinase
MEMNQLILSLGSNINSRSLNIKKACQAISNEVGSISKTSKIYSTPPLGFDSETAFLNCCILVETILNASEVLLETKKIEKTLGRTKKSIDKKYSSRTIDIDIILFNKKLITSPNLVIPHLLFRNRRFVLEPLKEIASNYVDPVSSLTIEQLLNNCKDNSTITIYKNQFL